MGIFDKITDSLGKKAGLKVAQIGANKLITRHTSIDVFSIDKRLMKAADDLIEATYIDFENRMEKSTLNEYEGAVLKLSVFRGFSEANNDEHMHALLSDSIRKINELYDDRIRSEVVLLMLSI